jgi:uncharacterized membrane protein YgdD (TMEM256/DUF423 family)
MLTRVFGVIGCLFALAYVALSAIATHAVKLDAIAAGRLDVALKLLLAHAFALLLLRLPSSVSKHEFSAKLAPVLALAGLCFVFGTLIFSGSLMLAAFSGQKFWVMPAPFGGGLLMFGWLLWAVGIWRGR